MTPSSEDDEIRPVEQAELVDQCRAYVLGGLHGQPALVEQVWTSDAGGRHAVALTRADMSFGIDTIVDTAESRVLKRSGAPEHGSRHHARDWISASENRAEACRGLRVLRRA